MASSLIVSNSIDDLQKYAHDTAAKFNPADVFWLTSQKSIQVKETTEFLQQSHLASIGERKLMIVCDMATMTPQAQNKMLKTIEDDARTEFLLLSTNAEGVINTIKSRCMTRYFPQRVNKTGLISTDIKENLKKVFDIEIDEKALNARQKQDILDTLSKINRNVAANCNVANQQDLLYMRLLKYAKNGSN